MHLEIKVYIDYIYNYFIVKKNGQSYFFVTMLPFKTILFRKLEGVVKLKIV